MKGWWFSRVCLSGAAFGGSGLPFLLLALLPAPASARLLDLGWTPSGVLSQASAVSGDGRVVVGQAQTSSKTHQLFLWTEQGGMTVLLSAPEPIEGMALSPDGDVLAGSSTVAGHLRAFRWDAAGGLQTLGTLGGDNSRAYGISADGRVVVGAADNALAVRRAFRWSAAQGMQDLGALAPNGAASAYGVSADGEVVVGAAEDNGILQAVRWHNGGIQSLGALVAGTVSAAYAISADGRVVVGSSDTDAFRWSSATGMQSLGSLGGGLNAAAATNADGSVIVGSSALADGNLHGFRWAADTGMVDLGVLSGGTYSSAYGVSHDGRVIVGEGDSREGLRAIVWSTQPAVVNTPQDLGQLHTSVRTSADTLARLLQGQERRNGQLAMPDCLPGATQRYCLGLRSDAEFAAVDEDSRQYRGVALAGWRLNQHLSLGLNLSLARITLNTQEARQDAAYGAGLWLAYQQDAASALGWNAWAAVATSAGQARFQRGEQMADVQAASSRLRLTANAQRLTVGYGIGVGQSVLTPELALRHGSGEHPTFTERNVALPLQVDSAQTDVTYASLTLRSFTPLNGKTTLHLTLAADALLDDDQPAFTGSSDIPGLNRFAFDSSLSKRNLVPSAAAQISYALNAQATVAGGVQVAASPYEQEAPMLGVAAQFSYRF